MSKVIEKIISSPTAPSNKNVGWWNGKELKFYTNGEWKTSGGSSNNKSLLDIVTLINKPLPVFNIYDVKEEHPIEDFGISEDFLFSMYFNKHDDPTIYINTIYTKTGMVYNKGGYMRKFGENGYELIIYTEDGDEFHYDHMLSIDFNNKTGMFIISK